MAAVAVILGGTVGFFSALISLVLFNASWFFALGLWTMGGFAIALLMVALAMVPHRAPPRLEPKHA